MYLFHGKRGILITLSVWIALLCLVWLVRFPYPVSIVLIVLAYLFMGVAAMLLWRFL